MVTLIALALAGAAPSAEALALGRQIAEQGTLAGILPVIQSKETDDLVAAHPALTPDEAAKLRAIAKRVFEAGREKLMAAEARAWAEQLTVPELRAVAAFQASAAGKRYRSAAPAVIASTMQSVGELDFKGDVLAAYCKETGKLCDK